MSERRSVIVPPEMTKGSMSGSVSSNSSARVIRIRERQEIQEAQLPTAPLELSPRSTFQHTGHQAIARVEKQDVQRALRPRATGRRILLERQLKKRVQLNRRAAANRILDDHSAAVDVSCSAKLRDPRACARGQPSQYPPIAIAQFGSTIRHTRRRIEQSIEHHEGIRTGRSLHHLELKVVRSEERRVGKDGRCWVVRAG